MFQSMITSTQPNVIVKIMLMDLASFILSIRQPVKSPVDDKEVKVKCTTWKCC